MKEEGTVSLGNSKIEKVSVESRSLRVESQGALLLPLHILLFPKVEGRGCGGDSWLNYKIPYEGISGKAEIGESQIHEL